MEKLVNKIVLEDCFSFLARLPEDCVDLAVIDPPYNMGKGTWDAFKSQNDFLDFTEEWLNQYTQPPNRKI